MVHTIIHDFKTLSNKSKLWVGFATITTLVCSIIAEPSNILGIIGAVSGILFVTFVANKKISTYYFGAIFSAIYSYLAFKNKIYGDFLMNCFYHLPTQFIGLTLWKSDMNNDDNIDVENMNAKQVVYTIIIDAILVGFLAFILRIVGSAYPLRDACTNVFSVTAMILMMNRYKEQWIFWILVNGISVYMWMSVVINTGSGYATLIQWCVFFINSLYGFLNWNTKNIKEK